MSITSILTMVIQAAQPSAAPQDVANVSSVIQGYYSPTLLEERGVTELLGSRIGYYTGSFDPPHRGHKKLIDQVLQENLVDFVIVYPVPGGDTYKNRSDFALRKRMMKALCHDDPRVIMTDQMPAKMQQMLSPYFAQMTVFGIIGSDVVLSHLSEPNPETRQKISRVFMRGLPIPEKHAETTIGAIMALPAPSFIVSLRANDDLSHLQGMFEDRPMKAFMRLEAPFSHLSSTKVRAAVKAGEPITEMVGPEVEAIIREHGLYKSESAPAKRA